MKQPTIAAIATPIGPGGIGIIRISGPDSFTIAAAIFIPKNIKIAVKDLSKKNIDISLVKSHRLYYGHIIHPDNGNIVDEVLVAFMKAPNTYTTEDVVEIQAHSGFASLDCLLSVVLKSEARIAEPGEFTKRAFLGGRIDLTQAEGIIDLINAKTNRAALVAAKRLKGSTRLFLEELRLVMRKIQAKYEGMLEFSEQLNENDIENGEYEIVQKNIIPKIELILKNEKDKILYQEGVVVAIVGAPNVGKSSLMNRLLEEDRSIVTNLPGTTRDVIKEQIIINSLPVALHDTAGLREAGDTVEKIGINKSIAIMEEADLILFVVDACIQFSLFEKEIIEKYSNKKILIVLNKIDICSNSSLIRFDKKMLQYKVIKISAKENLFIDKLRTAIFEISTKYEQTDVFVDSMSLNQRQYCLLNKIKKQLYDILDLMYRKVSVDILSCQIGECIDILDQISGLGKQNDLFDHIFNSFCVGK